MPPEDSIRILHMIEAANAVAAFVASKSRSDLDTDRMFLFALIRAVEVFGEAASRVSPETRSAHANIPWLEIVGMRNRLVHAYFSIDRDILWKAAVEEIPPLLPRLRAMSNMPRVT